MTNPLPWTKRYNANSFLRAKIVDIYDKTSGSIKFADSIIENFYKNDILKSVLLDSTQHTNESLVEDVLTSAYGILIGDNRDGLVQVYNVDFIGNTINRTNGTCINKFCTGLIIENCNYEGNKNETSNGGAIVFVFNTANTTIYN